MLLSFFSNCTDWLELAIPFEGNNREHILKILFSDSIFTSKPIISIKNLQLNGFNNDVGVLNYIKVTDVVKCIREIHEMNGVSKVEQGTLADCYWYILAT